MKTFRKLEEISRKDVLEVGGKAASLGELINAGFSVPSGFVISTQIYKKFYNQDIPEDLRKQILEAFSLLDAKKIAVRSSAVVEDSENASWAGQLETYLNVKKENLIEKIKQCWNSIHSERALVYAKEKNIARDELLIAVIVQKMVNSKVSGVTFTVNPVTQNFNEMVIESTVGLGESLAQGIITPESFVIDKKNLGIKNKTIQANKISLSMEQMHELVELCLRIGKRFNAPQDIEWAIDKAGKIWIIQSRPITTL